MKKKMVIHIPSSQKSQLMNFFNLQFRGSDDHLVEFLEALRAVAKALWHAAEGKTSAQDEAAELILSILTVLWVLQSLEDCIQSDGEEFIRTFSYGGRAFIVQRSLNVYGCYFTIVEVRGDGRSSSFLRKWRAKVGENWLWNLVSCVARWVKEMGRIMGVLRPYRNLAT